MFRLCKIGYVTVKAISPIGVTGITKFGNSLCRTARCGQTSFLQRFYSSKSSKDGPEKVKIKPKVPPPCPPPPYFTPPKKPAAFQDCKTPNLYDEVPLADKPWHPTADEYRKRQKRLLIIGIIILLASLYGVYKVTNYEQKVAKKEVKEKRCRKGKVRKVKNPEKSKDIPTSVPYLLIGGGTASFSAFRAIKSADPYAKVLVIAGEDQFPYMRPPLSKEIWYNEDEESMRKYIFKQWNGAERSLFYEPEDFYSTCPELLRKENGGVAVARGWTVSKLDVVNHKAYLEDGHQITYEKCLIATGAIPRNLEVFTKASEDVMDRVTTYRNICDFDILCDILKTARTVAVVGGGFLGSELSCSLARYGKKHGGPMVYQIFRENGNMGKILPEYLSLWTTEKVKAEGVKVKTNAEVVEATYNDTTEKVQLKLSSGEEIEVDHVIVAVGVTPNTSLAEEAELEVDPELGGYLVNTELQARSNLYIAGDCACFYDPRLGRRRVEHHDHAVVTGRLAGENMTGAEKPYLHQSMFWSDLGPDVGYEAIGIVDSSLPTVGIFAKCTPKDTPRAVVEETGEGDRSITEENAEECPPATMDIHVDDEDNYGKGVIFYLKDDIVVGIVMWNVFNRMPIARQVLKDERKYEDLNEVAKLFNIHEE